MIDLEKKKKIVVILGMARSGTSFIASWLNKCGLYLGQDLLEPDNIWNEKGFFEDKSIIKINNKIFKRTFNIIDKFLVKFNIASKVTLEDINEAKNHIKLRNSQNKQWGWKVPSTTMLWEKLWFRALKELKMSDEIFMVVCFRDYQKVIDSLMRVKYLKCKNNFFFNLHFKIFKNKYANNYLKEWIINNQEVLKVIESKQINNLIIVDTQIFLNKNEFVFRELINWGIELNYIDPQSIYEYSLMDRRVELKYCLNTNLVLKAKELELQVKEKVKLCINEIELRHA